ncbi:hypothetical protein ECG_07780 [Echinococcus granulosus]|nr:hypothetical protein ECG_07780 [Echinococcus granulosus]
MGCIISCGLKLILQIFNIVLCVAFLAVALFGILLKYSKSVVQHLLSKVFDQFNIGEEDLRQLTRFIIDDADYIAIILVVIGLALAALCLIGCIASCCGCNMLLKIYATLLIILLVAQIIAVSMVFSDPTLLTSLIVSSLEELLKSFGDVCYGRKMPSTIWNVVMTVNPKCCGMDGWGDFEKLNKSIPAQCCNMTMGCVISCGLKLVLQILNIILCVALLAAVLFGILLKSSKSIVQHLLSRILDQFNIGDEDLRQLARFITENSDGIAVILIVVGLALAAVCLIGCIASCCGYNILLKIFARHPNLPSHTYRPKYHVYRQHVH